MTMDDTINRIAQLRNARASELADLEAQINTLMAQYEAIAEPYNNEIAALEEECKVDVRAFGKSFENPFVKITYRRATTVKIWDSDRLKDLAKKYPALLNYKKDSERREFFKFEYKAE